MKNAEAFSSNDKILTPLRTLNELLRFVIPKGNKEMPIRIILALIFLILATLVSVYTPFLSVSYTHLTLPTIYSV